MASESIVSGDSVPSGRNIAPEISIPINVSWNQSPGTEIDPPPPTQPGFKCRCKRCCIKIPIRDLTPTLGIQDQLKFFSFCEKLCLNSTSEDCYLQIYSGEESSPHNVILTIQRIRKKGDSCMMFIDPSDRIILKSDREGTITTVKMGQVTLGLVSGAPGDLCSFQRSFSITMSPKTPMEKKYQLKVVGCCAKLLCCSPVNAFYLDEFIIRNPDGGEEIGWIRRGEGKMGSPTVTYSPSIADDDKLKGLILVAAVNVFEIFMERHYSFNVGSVGAFYIVVFGLFSTIVGGFYCFYQFQQGVWTI